MASGEWSAVQTVGELRKAIEGLDDSMTVTFQGENDWDGAEAVGGLEIKKDDGGLEIVTLTGAGWFARMENSDED